MITHSHANVFKMLDKVRFAGDQCGGDAHFVIAEASSGRGRTYERQANAALPARRLWA